MLRTTSAGDTPVSQSNALNTLILGNCFVHWPMRRSPSARRKFALDNYGPIGEVHSFGEIFQMLELLRGERDVPQTYRRLAHVNRNLKPVPQARTFNDLDLVLLSPSSPVEITFRAVYVNRTALMRMIAHLIEDETGEAQRYLARWSRVGLAGINEEVRKQSGEKLLEYLQGDSPAVELARQAVVETRSCQGDLRAGFRRARDMFRCPIGVVVYIFRYMPDGRPISWPAGYREEILSLAQEFDLPAFDPVALVNEYGVEKALLSGHSHYSESFMPVIGNALSDFAESVHRKGHCAGEFP